MRQTTPTLATEPAQKARERKGHGQGHPWRQSRKAPSSSPKPTAPPQATAHKHRGDPEDSTDYGERIKNLEAIRRSARKAGEHAVAKQLTLQIADLRRENASARPIHEKIASAEAKLALAQHEAARAAELVANANERKEAADKDLEDATPTHQRPPPTGRRGTRQPTRMERPGQPAGLFRRAPRLIQRKPTATMIWRRRRPRLRKNKPPTTPAAKRTVATRPRPQLHGAGER